MKTKRYFAFSLSLLMILFAFMSIFAASAAPKYGADTWVAYNSKYVFYMLDGESGNSIVRIDSAGKTKTVISKTSVYNLIYCDESYLYFTAETSKANFKKLAVDKEMEESQYGAIHIDIIRFDIAKGTKKTVKSNLPLQTPNADAKYFYYTTDNKNVYRMKHDGTSSKKYMSIDDYDYEPITLSTGQKIVEDWSKNRTLVTGKDGITRAIQGFATATDQYLFFWQDSKVGNDYMYSLVRYSIDGESPKKITTAAMQNREYPIFFDYHAGYLYYIDAANEKFIIKRMDMSGKISTFKDVTKVCQDGNSPEIFIAGNWLMLYDDVDSGGYWGEYLAKYSIK